MQAARAAILVAGVAAASSDWQWSHCDVTDARFGAIGDGVTSDTLAVRSALRHCSTVVLPPSGVFLTGPLNLTSNQRLQVDGTLLASVDKSDYPLVQPLIGYGWGNDMNCFPPDYSPHKVVVGSLRYSPVIGAYNASNVSVVGTGVIDGQGEIWWQNCTACHYPPHNDSSFCEIASRPKLLEFQFVDGLQVFGTDPATPLHLKDSPFWTLTPSYSQNIHVHDLFITAPMDKIGNTDGVNLDSCRNAVVEDVLINNSDDGVCVKSGLDGFGLNLAIPTENVLVQNITCQAGGRCGFAVGSEMSGGIRNVTFRDSSLGGQRGIDIKPSVGRGGYIMDVLFQNIYTPAGINMGVGTDGVPLIPDNHLVPLVTNLRFDNITGDGGCHFACDKVNRTECFNMSFTNVQSKHCSPPASPSPPLDPPSRYGCKSTPAWKVCIPFSAPVNVYPDYANYAPTTGNFSTLGECNAACQ